VAGKPVGQTAEQQQAHSTAQHAAQAGQERAHSTAQHDAQGSTQQHAPQQQLETQQQSEQHEQLQQQLEGLHHLVASNVPQQQQQQQGADSTQTVKSATPLPRPRAAKLWSIAVTDRGVLQGMPEPQHVSPKVQALLQRVLDTVPGLRSQQQQQQVLGIDGPSSSNNSSSSSSSRDDISWSEADIQLLLSARGVDMDAVVAAADDLRAAVAGDDVRYVVNRNINYTNVCTYACKFCAFSKVRH
jgi:hypothetical protein